MNEITQTVEKSSQTDGRDLHRQGLPKNFVHQTEAMVGEYSGGHSYAIQYTTDAPHWGGLSGCAFEGGCWGKVKREASKVQVFSDATITMPLVGQALRVSGKRRKCVPVFDRKEGGLELSTRRDRRAYW